MHFAMNEKNIIHSVDNEARIEQIEQLLKQLERKPNLHVPGVLKQFLKKHLTDDVYEAALIGLCLREMNFYDADSVADYARMIPLLILESTGNDLKTKILKHLMSESPLQLYEQITKVRMHGDPQSVDYYYAYWMQTQVSIAAMKGSFSDYL